MDQVDIYHGIAVPDPYRWLEDSNTPATRRWIAAQNRRTRAYLESARGRRWVESRLTELWNYEKFGVPERRGRRYFFARNDGLQNQSVICVADRLDGEPRVLLDPNALSEDGTVALVDVALSDDGRWLAYGLSSGGSDWQTWRVRDAGSGQELPDLLRWVKFSRTSWTGDGSGFYYSRYDEPARGEELEGVNDCQKLYLHRLGRPQEEDLLVYERPDRREWGFEGRVTDDGRYLIIHVWSGTGIVNGIFYKSLTGEATPVVELLSGFDARYRFVGNDGEVFWLLTDHGAPQGRLVAVDLARPEPAAWREVVAESASTLEEVRVVGERFVASYLTDARSEIRLFAFDGRPCGEIPLPGIGTASGFTGRREDRETFYAFTSFTVPTTLYRYDFDRGRSSVFRRPRVGFDPSRYETRQVFYRSKDGTRVPMFLTYRKGLERDGTNPTLLHGYGGFRVSMTPWFDVPDLVWMEMGGIFAVANIRGGGEYGEAWHQAGVKLDKQNVFDDFIAAGEWLVASRYTSRERLAITGRSNGGLLVGAVLTQRPDLVGAAVAHVGVFDMLRFPRFTIGWAWVSEYGSPEDSDEFRAIYAYSPYHNVRPGTTYPAALVTTADHDDRVVPAHSFKFAAALQATQAGPQPILIRIETRAGHGAGKPTAKQIDEAADVLAFLEKALGIAMPSDPEADRGPGPSSPERSAARARSGGFEPPR